jgi:hypothetical protein
VSLVDFGDGGETSMIPGLLFEDMADQVILVEALHNSNDAALLLVVQPAKQSVIEPGVYRISLRLGVVVPFDFHR